MPYEMHRVFCGTPGDLEEERDGFYKVMGELNEQEAMPRGILLVSVSIVPHMADKRIFQSAVTENIRACRFYVLVVEDTWGPPAKNFERDFAIAERCREDASLPMQEVAVLFKKPLLPDRVEPGIAALQERIEGSNAYRHARFENLEGYRRELRGILSAWLATIEPATADR